MHLKDGFVWLGVDEKKKAHGRCGKHLKDDRQLGFDKKKSVQVNKIKRNEMKDVAYIRCG